ncbi:hypothetical protein ON010_g9226 [Phytophthora cinnamomi]|nr:hypothetical protein ON010_g9226 [Phytophthora cinnamomi]
MLFTQIQSYSFYRHERSSYCDIAMSLAKVARISEIPTTTVDLLNAAHALLRSLPHGGDRVVQRARRAAQRGQDPVQVAVLERRENSAGHGRGAREGRVGHDVHALIRAERRVRQLRAELERRVGVVPRPQAIMLAPDDAAVGCETGRPGDED